MDQEKVTAVQKLKITNNLKEIGAVLALVGFYEKFLPYLRKTSKTQYQLPKKQKKFLWTKERKNALQ